MSPLAGSQPTERRRAGSLGVQTRVERDAITAAAIAGVVGFALGLIVLWGKVRPIAGDQSVGTVAGLLAGLAAAASFAVPYLRSTDPLALAPTRGVGRVIRFVATLGLTIVCLGFAYIAVEALALIFQQGFVGLDLDPFAGAVACALAAAASAYLTRPLGEGIDTRVLGVLVPSFLAVGVISSMLTASNERWWQLHFSELGAEGGLSGLTFNLTLVVCGLLVAVLGAYVDRDLGDATAPGSRTGWVGALLGLIGVLMVLVGIVRVDVAEYLHVVFASGMVVVFVALCVLLPMLAPKLPKQVHIVSATVVAGTLVALVLWVPVGYYNFTGFELAAAGLIFVWLTVFVRSIAAVAADRHAAANESDAEAAIG